MTRKAIVQIIEVRGTTLIAEDIETKEQLTQEVDEVIAEDFHASLSSREQEGEGLFMDRSEFYGV
jgi:hypothetical protein